jgi:ADP-ribose pyrophosphatase YjhB (NUDIX family)
MDTQIKIGAIVENTDKILLIKEWSNNKNGHYWNIIKGTFDSSLDETLEECAIREAKEETDITISLVSFINIAVKHGFNTRIYINFVAAITGGKPQIVSRKEQVLRKEDITEVKWFNRKRLRTMKEEEFINDVVFEAISKWLNKEIYPLNLLTEKILKS